MKKLLLSIVILLLISPSCTLIRQKLGKGPNMAMYECGYVYEPGLMAKLNPMAKLQKGILVGVTDNNNSDLGKAAISIFYQAHLHPKEIVRYVTETPNWETCGDAILAGFMNRDGLGLTSTDGEFKVDGTVVEYAQGGTYFHGFKPSERGEKTVQITSSDGDDITVKVGPGEPLEIESINGKPKGEADPLDGTQDLVLKIKNGDADPNSKIHVQLVSNVVGTPVLYDLFVSTAKNEIRIPASAFKNYEGSPSPFMQANTLLVNRITENLIEGTDAGAIRVMNGFMDWAPISVSGDIAKGGLVTAGFDESKNTNISIDMSSKGVYNYQVNKKGPFYAPPTEGISKVAIASLVVRGNLQASETNTHSYSSGNMTTIVTEKITKWFPEISEESWQNLSDILYLKIATALKENESWELVDLDKIINSKAYNYTKAIKDTVSKTFVEVGAGGTKRILTTSTSDAYKDLGLTFPADFVSERLVRELGVDMVLAITIDMNMNFETEALDPVVKIVAFAPSVSYRSGAEYFSMTANTSAVSLDQSKEHSGSVEEVLYKMIRGEDFVKEFISTLKSLESEEKKFPVYAELWDSK
ncbi:hypothetical protein GYB22_11380 [bacterium]|nr:hypothetical protein [bacterium]